MKIQYIHASDPETVKIFDTVKVYHNPNNPRVFKTQEEFDDFELEHFTKDKEQGTVISYEVVEET